MEPGNGRAADNGARKIGRLCLRHGVGLGCLQLRQPNFKMFVRLVCVVLSLRPRLPLTLLCSECWPGPARRRRISSEASSGWGPLPAGRRRGVAGFPQAAKGALFRWVCSCSRLRAEEGASSFFFFAASALVMSWLQYIVRRALVNPFLPFFSPSHQALPAR